MGSDDVEGVNAISGERCSPHPHIFSDRMIRPGDQAYFDIIHSFNGYRTCYYRTFAVGRATPSQRDAYKQRARVDGRRDRARASPASRPIEIAKTWPRPRSSDSPTRWKRSASSSATAGLGAARTADHQPPELVGRPGRDQGGHGVRARDLLPGRRWPFGRPHRGGGRGHGRRPRHPDALPRRRARRRQSPTDRRWEHRPWRRTPPDGSSPIAHSRCTGSMRRAPCLREARVRPLPRRTW